MKDGQGNEITAIRFDYVRNKLIFTSALQTD